MEKRMLKQKPKNVRSVYTEPNIFINVLVCGKIDSENRTFS